MSRTCLIIAPAEDVHTKAVQFEIGRLGADAMLLDTALFPTAWQLSTIVNAGGHHTRLVGPEGDQIDLSDVSGLWWRRPRTFRPAPTLRHPSLVEFVRDECSQAVRGALSGVSTFINPLSAGARAALKLEQLRMALKAKFRIPATIVTNDPKEAEQFARTVDDCIYKPFNGVDFGPWETRPLTADDIRELWRVRSCPVILQEHVRGDFDVRVTVVGDQVFAAALMFHEGYHPVDCRADVVPVNIHTLNHQITQQIQALVTGFGLFYAAIDLRYSASDGYTFFELNPDGQYLWIEIETGLPISAAIARLLVCASEAA